ncbi:MAG: hypothetical protein MUC36_17715 [Planctomycetes bacterium]|jgi:hypothetical protein|nr:hypothetical protein [Planctomycetota bacterium]
MIDLVCLVADKNMESVVGAVLDRHEALGTRKIEKLMLVHPQRDSACYHDPTSLLRGHLGAARHALVILDRAWEGVPDLSAEDLEADVDRRLQQFGNGWARAVVIEPELEVWLFRRSPRLDEALGWRNRQPGLREQLAGIGLWPLEAAKPTDPKQAMEWALWEARKPRSSSIYRTIASTVGMKECVDPSFLRFQSTLRHWFPPV